ncbi:uncharacterized protein LOC122811740 [Protopterus annectens]|uniref:uncharacterized protein LOC122811740 n=1 Tax=Protopterus annectens TaxID=7888 RepID=UPI001CF94FBF|nr:uncharacterized protein LOC122811740 [Protopterus annectens]
MHRAEFDKGNGRQNPLSNCREMDLRTADYLQKYRTVPGKHRYSEGQYAVNLPSRRPERQTRHDSPNERNQFVFQDYTNWKEAPIYDLYDDPQLDYLDLERQIPHRVKENNARREKHKKQRKETAIKQMSKGDGINNPNKTEKLIKQLQKKEKKQNSVKKTKRTETKKQSHSRKHRKREITDAYDGTLDPRLIYEEWNLINQQREASMSPIRKKPVHYESPYIHQSNYNQLPGRHRSQTQGYHIPDMAMFDQSPYRRSLPTKDPLAGALTENKNKACSELPTYETYIMMKQISNSRNKNEVNDKRIPQPPAYVPPPPYSSWHNTVKEAKHDKILSQEPRNETLHDRSMKHLAGNLKSVAKTETYTGNQKCDAVSEFTHHHNAADGVHSDISDLSKVDLKEATEQKKKRLDPKIYKNVMPSWKGNPLSGASDSSLLPTRKEKDSKSWWNPFTRSYQSMESKENIYETIGYKDDSVQNTDLHIDKSKEDNSACNKTTDSKPEEAAFYLISKTLNGRSNVISELSKPQAFSRYSQNYDALYKGNKLNLHRTQKEIESDLYKSYREVKGEDFLYDYYQNNTIYSTIEEPQLQNDFLHTGIYEYIPQSGRLPPRNASEKISRSKDYLPYYSDGEINERRQAATRKILESSKTKENYTDSVKDRNLYIKTMPRKEESRFEGTSIRDIYRKREITHSPMSKVERYLQPSPGKYSQGLADKSFPMQPKVKEVQRERHQKATHLKKELWDRETKYKHQLFQNEYSTERSNQTDTRLITEQNSGALEISGNIPNKKKKTASKDSDGIFVIDTTRVIIRAEFIFPPKKEHIKYLHAEQQMENTNAGLDEDPLVNCIEQNEDKQMRHQNEIKDKTDNCFCSPSKHVIATNRQNHQTTEHFLEGDHYGTKECLGPVDKGFGNTETDSLTEVLDKDNLEERGSEILGIHYTTLDIDKVMQHTYAECLQQKSNNNDQCSEVKDEPQNKMPCHSHVQIYKDTGGQSNDKDNVTETELLESTENPTEKYTLISDAQVFRNTSQKGDNCQSMPSLLINQSSPEYPKKQNEGRQDTESQEILSRGYKKESKLSENHNQRCKVSQPYEETKDVTSNQKSGEGMSNAEVESDVHLYENTLRNLKLPISTEVSGKGNESYEETKAATSNRKSGEGVADGDGESEVQSDESTSKNLNLHLSKEISGKQGSTKQNLTEADGSDGTMAVTLYNKKQGFYPKSLREAVYRIRRHTAPDSDTDDESENVSRQTLKSEKQIKMTEHNDDILSCSSQDSNDSDDTVIMCGEVLDKEKTPYDRKIRISNKGTTNTRDSASHSRSKAKSGESVKAIVQSLENINILGKTAALSILKCGGVEENGSFLSSCDAQIKEIQEEEENKQAKKTKPLPHQKEIMGRETKGSTELNACIDEILKDLSETEKEFFGSPENNDNFSRATELNSLQKRRM